MLRLPQVPAPVEHHFAPGVYVRSILMLKGSIVIGHEHKTEHFNLVIAGRAKVILDGKLCEIAAPCIFRSLPGVRKVLLIEETMIWTTIHPTDETDLAVLEEKLIVKSTAFQEYQQEIEMLRQNTSIEPQPAKGQKA